MEDIKVKPIQYDVVNDLLIWKKCMHVSGISGKYQKMGFISIMEICPSNCY